MGGPFKTFMPFMVRELWVWRLLVPQRENGAVAEARSRNHEGHEAHEEGPEQGRFRSSSPCRTFMRFMLERLLALRESDLMWEGQ